MSRSILGVVRDHFKNSRFGKVKTALGVWYNDHGNKITPVASAKITALRKSFEKRMDEEDRKHQDLKQQITTEVMEQELAILQEFGEVK